MPHISRKGEALRGGAPVTRPRSRAAGEVGQMGRNHNGENGNQEFGCGPAKGKKRNLGVVVRIPEKSGAAPDPRCGTESQGEASGKVSRAAVDRCRWAGAASLMWSVTRWLPAGSPAGVSLPGPSDPAGMDVLDSTHESSGPREASQSGGSTPGCANRRCGKGSGILGRARKSRAHTRGGAASGRGGAER